MECCRGEVWYNGTTACPTHINLPFPLFVNIACSQHGVSTDNQLEVIALGDEPSSVMPEHYYDFLFCRHNPLVPIFFQLCNTVQWAIMTQSDIVVWKLEHQFCHYCCYNLVQNLERSLGLGHIENIMLGCKATWKTHQCNLCWAALSVPYLGPYICSACAKILSNHLHCKEQRKQPNPYMNPTVCFSPPPQDKMVCIRLT